MFVAYRFAVSKTIRTHVELNDIKERADLLNTVDAQIALLTKKTKEQNKILGNDYSTDITFSERLLEYITKYAKKHNLKLIEFPEVHRAEHSGMLFETYSTTVEGGYKEILELIYNIETNSTLGNISSVEYFTEKNIKNKQIELHAKIYMQKIKRSR